MIKAILKLTIILLLVVFFSSSKNKTTKMPPIEWVEIPGGSFFMGSNKSEAEFPYDETLHRVDIKAFKISKYEITFNQYDAFCEATGRAKPDDEGWGRGNRPVINITWYDAAAFAEWAGYSLPTEAQWEYACRAGTTTAFNTGDNLTTSQANYNGNYPYKNFPKGVFRGKTMPVGSFPPNKWGLYDMHGNVWEWCSDWYNGSYIQSAQKNENKSQNNFCKVFRGGSWNMYAKYCRSAYRNYIRPDFSFNYIGFRVVYSGE